MTKKVKLAISACVIAAVAIVVALLCVFLIKDDPYKIEGQGTVTVTKNEDGTRTLTANPNQWHEFAGWYESVDGELSDTPVSQSNSYVIGEDAPIYTAVFRSSAINSLDRLLNGVYNTYSNAISNEQDYFNFSGDIMLTVTGIEGTTGPVNVDIDAGGFFNFNGQGNQLYLKASLGTLNVFGVYYVDNVVNANLYINIMGETKTIVAPSLSSVFTEIGKLSDQAWSLENIIKGAINDQTTSNAIYGVIDSLLGIKNAQGFYQSATNEGDNSTVSLRLGVMLKNLNDLLADFNLEGEAMEIINYVLGALTSEYQNDLLPSITLDLDINYETLNEKEVIDNINIDFNIADEYKINFGQVITIGKTDVNLIINDVSMGFAPTANSINPTDLEIFPDAINMLNMYVGGELTFLQETETQTDASAELQSVLTRTDLYNVELYADLNPVAILPAITDAGLDATKIDWENLGFLSLRISLDRENSNLENHYIDHNETPTVTEQDIVDDYINIFMDTEKYGAKIYAFIAGYKPYIRLLDMFNIAEDYIFNNVIDIPVFIQALTNKEDDSQVSTQSLVASANEFLADADSTTTANQGVFDIVVSILEQIIEKEPADNIIFSLINSILTSVGAGNANITLAQQNLSLTDYGTTLKLQFLRTILTDLLGEDVYNLGFQLDNLLFGQTPTHLALSLNEFKYGEVKRNATNDQTLGDYVNNNNQSILEIYNEEHPAIVAVNSTEIDNTSFSKTTYKDELKSLIGTRIDATELLLSDGTLTHEYNKTDHSIGSVTFLITNIEVLEDDSTEAIIKVSLRRSMSDYLGSAVAFAPFFGVTSLPEFLENCTGFDDMYYNLGIEVGIYTYETTIEFAKELNVNANINGGVASAQIAGNVQLTSSSSNNLIGMIEFIEGSTSDDLNIFKNLSYSFTQNGAIILSFTVTNTQEEYPIYLSITDLVGETLNVEMSYNNEVYTEGDEIEIESPYGFATIYLTISTTEASLNLNDLSFTINIA